MDKLFSETKINNYNSIYKNIIKFNNRILKSKKDNWNLNQLITDDIISKNNLNINENFFKLVTDVKPIIEFTNEFNISVIFKNNNDKQFFILELKSPYYELLNDKYNFDDFHSKNYFFKLVNEKNKLSDIDTNNENYIELKNEYNKNLEEIINKQNFILDKYNDLYNEQLDLYINNLFLYKGFINQYLIYKNDPTSNKLYNTLMYNFIVSSNSLYYNKYYKYENKIYFQINENTLYDYSKKQIITDKSNKYNEIINTTENIPINNQIYNLDNKINNTLDIDISKFIDKDFESVLTIQFFNNYKDFETYINENLINKNKILNKFIKQEDKIIDKHIKLNIKKEEIKEEVLYISNYNLDLNVNEYSSEINNKETYELIGNKWRNLLDNSNTEYSFVYDDLLWSSVNHLYMYLNTGLIEYSMNYDNVYYIKKNNNNYIGYCNEVIILNNEIEEKILLSKFLQNKELIDILLNTKNAILKDTNNNVLNNLMSIRNKLKNNDFNKKIKYLEYENFLNDFSKIVIKFLKEYDEDTQLSDIILKEIKKNPLYETYKTKFMKEYNNIFEIIKHNYILLL